MTARPLFLTPLDVSLLRQLGRAASLVEACRQLEITRDRGGYRLRRLARLAGGPVVRARRGGSGHGATQLTSRGARLLERASAPLAVDPRPSRARPGERPTFLQGPWHESPQPNIVVGGVQLFVGFRAVEGETVSVELDPESVILATRRYPTSARNVLAGTVREVRHRGPGTGPVSARVTVGVGGFLVEAAVTDRSVEALRLATGRRVILYVKATALQRRPGRAPRSPTRGSRPY
ncbi:MAG: TOBE domain-containing protein [Thermoplasmata archaeon]|nr:TOBE domain-containing protein [Thermoplasmata archaeon]